MTAHSTAATHLRRLHAKVADRELDDRTDAWFCLYAKLGEAVVGGLTPFEAQEHLAAFARLALMDPAEG